jgi:hypothetical protein
MLSAEENLNISLSAFAWPQAGKSSFGACVNLHFSFYNYGHTYPEGLRYFVCCAFRMATVMEDDMRRPCNIQVRNEKYIQICYW